MVTLKVLQSMAHVQVEISDEWCSLGISTGTGTVYYLFTI